LENGETIGTFTIMKRSANELMGKIHNGGPNSLRMPLILKKEMALHWLNEQLNDDEIENILNFEFAPGEMDAWPVNTIRTRKPDDVSVIHPLDVSVFPAL